MKSVPCRVGAFGGSTAARSDLQGLDTQGRPKVGGRGEKERWREGVCVWGGSFSPLASSSRGELEVAKR